MKLSVKTIFVLFLITSVWSALLTGNDEETKKPANEEAFNPFFVAQLKYAAKEYKQFGRVDETKMSWSPLLCKRPDPKMIKPGQGSISESEDAETHGGKVYFLFVKERAKYQNRAKEQPFGQILVKESWTYKPTKKGFRPDAKTSKKYDTDASLPIDQIRGGYLPFAEKDGKWYEADKLKDLFVMIKLSKDTPETDDGWIYGTVTKDGKVTSAGKVESCISCHKEQANDRMFFHPSFRNKPPMNPDFSHIRSKSRAGQNTKNGGKN